MRNQDEIYKALVEVCLHKRNTSNSSKHYPTRLCMISWSWFWILKKKQRRSAPWLWPFTLRVKRIFESNYKKGKIDWSADQTLKSSQMTIPQGFLLFSSLVSDWTPSWGDHHCQTKSYVWPLICITGDRLWARFLGWGEILSRFLLCFDILPDLHILHLFHADWGVPRAILSALSSTWARRPKVWLSRKRKYEHQKSGFEKCKENANIENWESEFETQGPERTSC